jgi:hypothetical protein
MTFELKDGVRYRMPVMFGPTPGPRQHPEGRPWTVEETGTMNAQWITINYLTRAEQLEALLPPHFKLRGEPVVSISFAYFKNLWWLAGRGYGIVFVDFPVTYAGPKETIEGHFSPMLWEGNPEAIMTGREELGFNKLFADIPNYKTDPETGAISGFASWYDFTFIDFEVHELEEVFGDRTLPGGGGAALFYKYVPRTSPFGKEGADVAVVTTSAPRPGVQAGAAPIKFDDANYRKWKAQGHLAWHKATFEQLPLTFHVVNGMAALDILEYRGVQVIEFSGPGTGVWANSMRTVET